LLDLVDELPVNIVKAEIRFEKTSGGCVDPATAGAEVKDGVVEIQR
jgi:hypothetical protein